MESSATLTQRIDALLPQTHMHTLWLSGLPRLRERDCGGCCRHQSVSAGRSAWDRTARAVARSPSEAVEPEQRRGEDARDCGDRRRNLYRLHEMHSSVSSRRHFRCGESNAYDHHRRMQRMRAVHRALSRRLHLYDSGDERYRDALQLAPHFRERYEVHLARIAREVAEAAGAVAQRKATVESASAVSDAIARARARKAARGNAS